MTGLLRDSPSLTNWDQFAKVETLKKRFGDSTLQVCEVMLKDMTDSKRVNTQVQRLEKVSTSRYNGIRPRALTHGCAESSRAHHLVTSLLAGCGGQATEASASPSTVSDGDGD